MPTQARERLLDSAEALFYRYGIQAIGIDRLLQDSGVGRASFYRHFESKEALVSAVLARRDAAWREMFDHILDACDGEPLALFDAMAARYAENDFRGCAFINAMVEAADRNSPWHQIAIQHKNALIERIAESLRAAGHTDVKKQATQWVMLLDGAVITAMREGHVWPIQEARRMAAQLRDQSDASS
ncbi:TetR/AcrR family transcriptional regulator [Salinisphaera hydrothermalis]|uniref:TetR family transcriptional regulator n=1 Tax=Salinisphaera hydrothermalis (strain C41B8) TaxID=1304275 RepID=A0A084IG56_SALHC|nr:TetR/AcrR family transcriptional regulator [Salinisphaera hydrothermalis]KEZ75690.1 TetR family transcriptional regulator [Salinisphaera hydrothermalis C41B8]